MIFLKTAHTVFTAHFKETREEGSVYFAEDEMQR